MSVGHSLVLVVTLGATLGFALDDALPIDVANGVSPNCSPLVTPVHHSRLIFAQARAFPTTAWEVFLEVDLPHGFLLTILSAFLFVCGCLCRHLHEKMRLHVVTRAPQRIRQTLSDCVSLAVFCRPERSQILDYLFKPNFGASLQILKVQASTHSDSIATSDFSTDNTPPGGDRRRLSKHRRDRNEPHAQC